MRSSSEIRTDIKNTQDELDIVNADLKNMSGEKSRLDILISVSNSLKTDVETYDLTAGGDWEGDLYTDGDTQRTSCASAVGNVNGSFSTTKTELVTAEKNAKDKRQKLIDRLSQLDLELQQAIAAESSTSYGY